MKSTIKIAITGATGHISYSAIFRLAAGEGFGSDQPVHLSLYDLPGTENVMEGLAMELADCCTPLVAKVDFSSDLDQAFTDIDYALLIGAKPRTAGMERSDLLQENGKIFVGQGEALNRSAKSDVSVLIVGNPCNTNGLVALRNAPDLNPRRFHAMLRLDQNRAMAQLAMKSGTPIEQIKGVTIWGNHSATQVPDVTHASMGTIQDPKWLAETFPSVVQKRGASVINYLGRSSAASAAKAAIDAIRSLHVPTPEGEWFTSGVWSDGNPYGLEEGLLIGMPCRSKGGGEVEIVNGHRWSDQLNDQLIKTVDELKAEREFCQKAHLF